MNPSSQLALVRREPLEQFAVLQSLLGVPPARIFPGVALEPKAAASFQQILGAPGPDEYLFTGDGFSMVATLRARRQGSAIAFDTSCSLCGSRPCVHGASLYFDVLERYRRRTEIPERSNAGALAVIKDWLAGVAKRQALDAPPGTLRGCVRYVITTRGGRRDFATMRISPVFQAQGRTLLQAKPIDLTGRVDRFAQDVLESLGDLERSLLYFVRGMEVVAKGTFEFRGSRDRRWLLDALDAGACVVKRGRGKPAGVRLFRSSQLEAPRFSWQISGDLKQCLRLDGFHDEHVLVDVGRPAILNLQSGEVVELDIEPQLLLALVSAPVVSQHLAGDVASCWKNLPSLAAIPSPRTIGDVEDRAIAPRPLAILLRGTRESVPDSRAKSAERTVHPLRTTVYFSYGGTRIRADDPRELAVFEESEGFVRYARDLRAESQYMSSMAELGCESSAADSLASRSIHCPPDQTLRWIRQLEQRGFEVELDGSMELSIVEGAAQIHTSVEPSGPGLFDVGAAIEVAGERVNLVPVLAQLIGDSRLRPGAPAPARVTIQLDDGRLVRIPTDDARALLAPLVAWLDAGGISTGAIVLSGAALIALASEQPAYGRGAHVESLRAFADALRELPMVDATPSGFHGTLRDYQRAGVTWLNVLMRAGLGGILADDMGLGKTIQVLAHLLARREHQPATPRVPSLIVAPTSVLPNWRDEAATFAPELRVAYYHGADRLASADDIGAADVVLTTYSLFWRDQDFFAQRPWDLLVLDEAQILKNIRSRVSRMAREIRAVQRVALTGTPLENHTGELWALMDCVLPGLLGDAKAFNSRFKLPIERDRDQYALETLQRRIKPFILRRKKADVAPELPEKVEVVRSIELGAAQRRLYETIRASMHERVRAAIAESGIGKASLVILDGLLKLRQAVCDPRLLKLPEPQHAESSKLDYLVEMLEELLAEGRTIIVFSQFAQMLGLIEAELVSRSVPYLKLTGSSTDRDALIKRFQAGHARVFLISLRAGGVGLNLTAADTVIHYDPWWNPAVEDQATDRAYRIGQDKNVFVYRLRARDSIEERILKIQERKSDLAAAILDGGTSTSVAFTESDIEYLFGGGQPL